MNWITTIYVGIMLLGLRSIAVTWQTYITPMMPPGTLTDRLFVIDLTTGFMIVSLLTLAILKEYRK